MARCTKYVAGHRDRYRLNQQRKQRSTEKPKNLTKIKFVYGWFLQNLQNDCYKIGYSANKGYLFPWRGVTGRLTFSEDRTVYTMPNTSKMDRTHWATEMPRLNMQRNVNMVKIKLSFVHKDTCLCFFQHKI